MTRNEAIDEYNAAVNSANETHRRECSQAKAELDARMAEIDEAERPKVADVPPPTEDPPMPDDNIEELLKTP